MQAINTLNHPIFTPQCFFPIQNITLQLCKAQLKGLFLKDLTHTGKTHSITQDSCVSPGNTRTPPVGFLHEQTTSDSWAIHIRYPGCIFNTLPATGLPVYCSQHKSTGVNGPGTILHITLLNSFLTSFSLAHTRVVEPLGLFPSELFLSYQLFQICLSCSKVIGFLDRQNCSQDQFPELAGQTLVLRRRSWALDKNFSKK